MPSHTRKLISLLALTLFWGPISVAQTGDAQTFMPPAVADAFCDQIQAVAIRVERTASRLGQPLMQLTQAAVAELPMTENFADQALEATIYARMTQGFSAEVITQQCFSAPDQFSRETDAIVRLMLDSLSNTMN